MYKKYLLISLLNLAVFTLFSQELNYIFGGPSDSLNGQFAGGLNGWEAEVGTNGAVWEWTEDGSGVKGAYWGQGSPIVSSSVANGAAIFNSDFLDNGGIEGNFGGGDSPSPHIGSLISPSFSCADRTSAVLMFTQYFRTFDAITSVGVSIDGGTTWVQDTLNDDLVTNYNSRAQHIGDLDEIILVDFSDVAAGQSDVKVRFTFDGDYYAWIIDDVAVIERPAHNATLGAYFMPVNLVTPGSQITTDSSAFSVEVSNNGSETLTDLVIKVSITDGDNAVIYEDSASILTFEAGAMEDIILPGIWAPGNLTEGVYFFTITARTSEDQPDANLQDNVKSQPFLISTTSYSKEFYNFEDNSPYFIGGYVPGNDYVIGNQYFTSDNWPDIAGIKATEASFAVTINRDDAPLAGKSVTIYLLEITDEVDGDDGSSFGNFDLAAGLSAENTQFKFVGIANYTFSQEDEDNVLNSSKFSTFVDLELNDFETFDPGVELKAGQRYLLAASYIDNNNTIRHCISNQTPGRRSRAQYYSFSAMIYDSEDGQWFSGFVGGSSPVMNLAFDITTRTDEIALPEHVVNIFPNPAASTIKVDLNFDQASKGIVVLADITGRVQTIKEFSNITSHRVEFDASDLANGTYLVRVATNDGTKTTKVIVQK